MAQKVIRDPVHNHIYFDKEADELLLRLLDCREVQRLRRIRQLGMSYVTYPGAEHSRFSHALGVVHLMKTALRYVEDNQGNEIPLPPEHRLAALAAALLHDIGHGPFSHVLEKDFGGQHEKWTSLLITGPDTQVHKELARQGAAFPQLVNQIIAGQDERTLWLHALLSGQLDVDRMDFLLRDSHFCGVPYGEFDHQWIFHTMRVRPVLQGEVYQPVWLAKATRAIEEYIFARYYMYWSVYFHQTTRGYEELLKAICRRARQLLGDGVGIPCTSAVEKFVSEETLDAEDFLRLDDAVLVAHFVQWADHGDKVLSDLARRFLTRQGFKPEKVTGRMSETPLEQKQTLGRIEEVLRAAGLPPEYYLLANVAVAQAYDYYHPEREAAEQTSATSILIEAEDGLQEISSLPDMGRLRAVTGQKERRSFYYVPKECRLAVRALLQGREHEGA